jgi:hypothetical protein
VPEAAGLTMLTKMSEGTCALHLFSVHNITWQALLAEFGKWNSISKRFAQPL